MYNILEGLERWIRQSKRSRILRKIALVMACMVIFTTTYALILPAITIDDEKAYDMPGLYLDDTGLAFVVDSPELKNEPGAAEELVLEEEFSAGEESGYFLEEETDESEAESETEAEVETEAETEPVPEMEGETESETEAEIEPELETESEAETEPESEVEPETEPQLEVETEAETEPESEVEPETEPESEVETEAETEPEPEVEAETEAESETEPVEEREITKAAEETEREQSLETTVLKAVEKDIDIRLIFAEGIELSEGAVLSVREITQADPEYNEYVKAVYKATNREEKEIVLSEDENIIELDAECGEITFSASGTGEPGKIPVSTFRFYEISIMLPDGTSLPASEAVMEFVLKDQKLYLKGYPEKNTLETEQDLKNAAGKEAAEQEEALYPETSLVDSKNLHIYRYTAPEYTGVYELTPEKEIRFYAEETQNDVAEKEKKLHVRFVTRNLNKRSILGVEYLQDPELVSQNEDVKSATDTGDTGLMPQTEAADFKYEEDGKVYFTQMTGAEDILLSALLEKLGVKCATKTGFANRTENGFAVLQNVTPAFIQSISSTDDQVISITPTGEDYIIRILKSTQQQEAIHLMLQDGTTRTINVKADGITELTAGDVTIRTISDLYLPQNASAYARVIDEEQSDAIALLLAAEKNGNIQAASHTPASAESTQDHAVAIGEEILLDEEQFSLEEEIFLGEEEGYVGNVMMYDGTAISSGGDSLERMNRGPARKTAYMIFDIGLEHVEENVYSEGFQVTLKLPEKIIGKDLKLYHIHDGQVEELLIEKEAEIRADGTEQVSSVCFMTHSFSEFVLQYTVDFHWEVNGKVYDFSMPGGGFISFSDLIEVLGVAKTGENDENEDTYLPGEVPGINDQDISTEKGINNDIQVSERTREFVADVESVVFSSPELVWVGKVDEESTVGGIKEENGLEIQYSTELTKEQIAKISSTVVESGDWALISLQPFESTESLTVTMKTGEVFDIRVTDYQLKKTVISDSGETWEITVTYGEDAQIPDGAELDAEEILPGSELYDGLLSASVAALETEEEDIEHIRFFDITIRNGEEIIEPKKAVTVEIRYQDPVNCDGSQDFDVIHFGSEGTDVLTLEVTVNEEDQTAREFVFQTESFSTFAIVSTPTQISQLVGNEYVLCVTNDSGQRAVLSPEQHTRNTNNLQSIPVTITGTRITADNVDTLPSWKITSGSQNGTYRLSTTYNNQTVYLNFSDYNNSRVTVSTNPQDLRILTRVGPNGGTQFRFAYNNNNNNNPVSLDLYYGNTGEGFSVYSGYSNNNNEYFDLYAIGELPPQKVTVHFVDRTGTLLTDVQYTGTNSYVTRNDDGTFTILNDWEGTAGTISLENDFGLTRYTYANTHLAKNTTVEWPTVSHNYTCDGIIIEPTLTSTGHALEFKTDIGASGTGQGQVSSHDFSEAFSAAPPNDDNKEYASEGDKDVYVILDPIPTTSGTGSTGSTGGSGGSGNNDFSNSDPVFHKDLTNNYDGTYELSLSVVGKALNESETPKVNVLLVVDTSSSMTNNTVTYVNENGQTVSGSRMAATQVELKKLGGQLLGRNDPTNDSTLDDDIVEVAMVTFDGNAYDNTLDWTTSDNVYESVVNGLQTHRGTNWEDALDAALIKAIAKKTAQPNEPVYVLFFTDGEPSQYSSFHYTSHTSDYGWRYFFAQYGKEASKDEARAMVNNGIQFYTMFAFGPSGNNQATYYGDTQFQLLHKLVQYAYHTNANLENKRAFNATNSTLLNAAFNAILQEINSSLGITDVVMNDSFTNLTVAGVNLRGNETDTGGFRYWKIPSGGTWEDRVAWDEAPLATYEATTGVQWDLSGITLENNVTYVVTFTVWPSQAAYDWVADLKNGVKTWDDAIAAGLANSVLYRVDDGNGGYTYEVQTNPQSTVPDDGSVGTNGITYKKTTQETVNEEGNDAGTTTYTTEDPDTYVKETITYTQNEDGSWTKTVVSETITAFNMPDKRMALTNTDFHVDKFWDVNGKLTELHNFLYHKDDDTGEWVSNQKQIIFKIAKGYDQEGNPAPYDKFGTDGLPLGWQAEESDYDWIGSTTSIEGHTIGTRWREDLDISFGLMLTHEKALERGLDLNNTEYLRTTYQGVTYYLLDYGWDYAIDEVYGLNYQFDFRSSVYHPMLIDGQPAHVKFKVENGVWTITEMEKDLTALTGNNILRGDLRIQKELQDVDGNRIRDDDTTTFDFTINLTNSDYVFIPDEGVETVPWYGVSKTTVENGETVTQYYFYQYAPNGVFDHYATEDEATISDEYGNLTLKPGYRGNIMQHGGASATVSYDGRNYTGYKEASATLHVKAEEDWSIANIPLGTVVTVSEPDKPGYVFVNAKCDGTSLETTYSDSVHTTASCEIPAGQTTTIKITNKEQPIDLLIFKAALIDEQDVLLEGAEFNLHKWDETGKTWLNVSGVTNPFAVNKNTGYQIQAIKPGLYKLHETKTPDGYIVTQDTYFKVVDRQILLCDEYGNTMIGSGDDAVPYKNDMAKVETTDNVTKLKLTVYNTPGVALPNTGGSGTNLIYLLGMILTAVGCCGIVMRRKRRVG